MILFQQAYYRYVPRRKNCKKWY